jgi:hypothetical protein
MRIATELRVKAILRRASVGGAAAYVVRRGDAERGALYLKIATLDGRARILGPAPPSFEETHDEGEMVAHLDPAGVAEHEAEVYLAQQADYDPDLWLVEIEDRDGRSFVED